MTERMAPSFSQCIGQEQVTAMSASASLAQIPNGVGWAIIKPRAQGVYLRLTGGAATSADMAIPVDVPVEVTTNLANVRLLQQSAGAIADVWYFG